MRVELYERLFLFHEVEIRTACEVTKRKPNTRRQKNPATLLIYLRWAHVKVVRALCVPQPLTPPRLLADRSALPEDPRAGGELVAW